MKKIIASALVAGLFTATGAFAQDTTADITVALPGADEGYQPVGTLTEKINLARTVKFTAADDRVGFVKNDFDAVISANVIAGVLEDAPNNRFGSAAGSNKGYNVFTGSSVGGSVSQCGKPIAKTVTNLGASEVKEGVLDLDEANGCGRTE